MIRYTVNVEGMMCGNCEKHVNEAVKENFRVKKVTSDFQNKTTEIITAEELDEEKLFAVIGEAGYKAVSVSSEPYEKKGLFF